MTDQNLQDRRDEETRRLPPPPQPPISTPKPKPAGNRRQTQLFQLQTVLIVIRGTDALWCLYEVGRGLEEERKVSAIDSACGSVSGKPSLSKTGLETLTRRNSKLNLSFQF